MMTQIRDILNERGKTHGDFTENARIHRQLQQVVASAPLYAALTAVNEIAIQVILGKIARIVTGDQMHKDSWDDIAGYAMLASDRVFKPESKKSSAIPSMGPYGEITEKEQEQHILENSDE
jgi:Domain of unknown function (DUF6378)